MFHEIQILSRSLFSQFGQNRRVKVMQTFKPVKFKIKTIYQVFLYKEANITFQKNPWLIHDFSRFVGIS